MSFLDEATAPDFASRGGRLYAHADFLGTIVPACLFLLVVFLTEHVCFQEQSILGMLKAHYSLADSRLSSLTDATSLLAVLVGVVFLFCLLFIVGEMLNAVSALTLDHFVTRKLLGYPFSLFVKRLAGEPEQDRAAVASEDPHLFSREMSTRPYRRLCINVVPLLVFEIIITIHWALDNDALLRHFTTEPKFSVAVAVLLCFFHLGLPIKGPGGGRNSRLNLGLAVHIFAVLLLGVLVGAALVAGYAMALLLFPGINLFLIGLERSKPDSRIIGYMKISFVNVFYWLAHLAGWAYIPPRSIVELAARRYRHSALDSSDSFYWMCLFEVEQRGGTISAYVYPLLSHKLRQVRPDSLVLC